MNAKLILSLPVNPSNISSFDLDGQTVGDMFDRLILEYPEVRSHIFDSEGNLHYYLQVYQQDKQITSQPLMSEIKEGDEVFVCCAIRGG